MFKRYISLNGELKIIFISIEILMSLSIVSQNSQFINKTYYYRQVLKVHNDQKDKGDNSGQFICFTAKQQNKAGHELLFDFQFLMTSIILSIWTYKHAS